MISPASKAIPSLFIGFIVVTASTHLVAQQHQPITVTRLYTASDGQTHADNVEVKMAPTPIYAEAEASEAVKVSEAQFFRLPKGKVQDWHNPAHRQYVVTLSGRGEVEIAGEQRVVHGVPGAELRPGHLEIRNARLGRGLLEELLDIHAGQRPVLS